MWGRPPSAVRRAQRGSSALLRQPVRNELRHARRRRRIQIRQHRHHISNRRTDFQIAVHPGRTAAVAKTSRAVDGANAEPVGIRVVGSTVFAGRQQFREVSIEQLIRQQCVRKLREVLDGGISAASGRPAIGQRVDVRFPVGRIHLRVSHAAVADSLVLRLGVG